MALKCKGVYIIGAKRTPFCGFGGALREMPAGHAFAAAATDAIQTATLDPALIDHTVVGNVHYLSQCDGGKTPRHCGLHSGVPIDRPAVGVNKACGSGLQAIITGAVDIITGVAKVSLTGGTEIMSSLPYLVKNTRFGTSLGKSYILEDYIQSQFPDSYTGRSLERMAEELAKKYEVTRRDADEFAVRSHLRWKAAHDSKAFDSEITKVSLKTKKKTVIIDKDEMPQPDVTLGDLSQIPVTFEGASVITSKNSSVSADGAVALILAGEDAIAQQQIDPLSRLVAFATVGSDPAETGDGAIPAIRKLLDVVKLTVNDVDLFEINETFAVLALLSARALDVDLEKVNVSGGALAMGNPVGATGARMAVHLVHELRRRKVKRGIAASSCGGGQGVAMLIEAL